MKDTLQKFNLGGRVAIITGGAGLLGVQHAEAIAEAGGIPILWDINKEDSTKAASKIEREYNVSSSGMMVDITNHESIKQALDQVLDVDHNRWWSLSFESLTSLATTPDTSVKVGQKAFQSISSHEAWSSVNILDLKKAVRQI